MVKDYSEIVIAIVDNDGKLYEVCSSINDVKHISAYKRLIKKVGNDCFGIADYFENINNKASITGFEIAKFVAASGNVVFFHTDVHNAFWENKEASIICPKDMSDIQKARCVEMIANLKDFTLYTGLAYVSKRKKICYQRVIYERFINDLIKENKENLKNEKR